MFICQTLGIHNKHSYQAMYRRVFLTSTVTAIAATLLLPTAALAKSSETDIKKKKGHKHQLEKSKHPSHKKKSAQRQESEPVNPPEASPTDTI
jgi:mannitol-specific phosphotransferase system IIBC component